MTQWTKDELNKVARAEELQIASIRRDGLSAVDGSWGYPTQPAWSPDGKKILFVAGGTYCDDWDCYDYANLLVMHADGTGIVTLQSGYDVDPAWRP